MSRELAGLQERRIPPHLWRVDQRVRVKKGSRDIYTGSVAKLNPDGSYAISFDDGDFQDVEARYVKALP